MSVQATSVTSHQGTNTRKGPAVAQRTIYYTGSSLDGFIATSDHSLDWLTSRDIDFDGPMAYPAFQAQVGAAVMGANTWQWLLDHDENFGDLPAWVVTHRAFDQASGVTFTDAPLAQVHAELSAAAGERDVWIVGGGGLAAAFHEAGLLDEVWIQLAPVTLGAGAPVLPAHVELRLEDVDRNRDFCVTRYTVVR